MRSPRIPIAFAFSVFVLLGAGCGADSENDPNESATTRAIREKVRADMEIDRLKRLAPRLAHVNEALEKAPTATVLAAAQPSGEGEGSSGAAGIERGEKLYTQNCAGCHGARGGGDGPLSASLVPKPAKHSDGVYMNALSNAHLFKVIEQGGTAVGKSSMMAPWGMTLSEAEIWDVVEFLRSLADPPYTGPVR